MLEFCLLHYNQGLNLVKKTKKQNMLNQEHHKWESNKDIQ